MHVPTHRVRETLEYLLSTLSSVPDRQPLEVSSFLELSNTLLEKQAQETETLQQLIEQKLQDSLYPLSQPATATEMPTGSKQEQTLEGRTPPATEPMPTETDPALRRPIPPSEGAPFQQSFRVG